MKFYYLPAILLLIIASQSSCNKGPDGGVPVYLKIDTVNLVSVNANGNFGPNSQAISDVWVQTTSIPATNLGAYQVPCNFPVLQDSNISFLVNAGVFESGQSEIRDIYPFFTADTFTIRNAVPGKTYTHTPTFTYLPSCTVAFPAETFENNTDYDSLTRFQDAGIVKYGNWCGKMTVSPTDTSVFATQISTTPYALPTGQEIWLELDYKCDVPFWIGINGYFVASGSITSADQEQILFVTPQTQWTHIYVKLSETIALINASFYRLTFQALNPSGSPGGSVYLDNIKIVYPK